VARSQAEVASSRRRILPVRKEEEEGEEEGEDIPCISTVVCSTSHTAHHTPHTVHTAHTTTQRGGCFPLEKRKYGCKYDMI
jgi:hypothetical protein